MSTLHWTISPFAGLYQSIATTGFPDQSLLSDLNTDLQSLTAVPSKNQSSRSTLEAGKIKLANTEYEVNQEFKIIAVELSDELNIDELISAEILLDVQQSHPDEGVQALKDLAKAAYYLRKEHILQIVSYIYNASNNDQLVASIWKKEETIKAIIKSFQNVHEELAAIHQLVQKARILEIGHTHDFKIKVSFRRNALQTQHETLSEILYGIVSKGLLSVSQFKELLNFLATAYEVDDLFAIHLLPPLVLFISKLSDLSDDDIKQLHSDFLKDLKNDNAYQQPMKVLLILIFFTYFITWCKASSSRLAEFDFDVAVESPMILAVQLGALEQLLIVNASLASISTDQLIEPLYDLRSLLEQHLPHLEAKRVLDVNEEETRRIKASDPSSTYQVYIHTTQITISENLKAFMTQNLHEFTQAFISDAAFLLIKLKDSEEDFLLSSQNDKEEAPLDSIAKRADLERFYLSVFYLYSTREDFITEFWTDRESNAYGFITWASNANESLLMRSTFLIMMSALAKGDEGKNASYVYGFIAGLDKLSWTKICEDMMKIIEKIQALEAKDGELLNFSEFTILQMACMLNIIYYVALNGNDELKKTFDTTLLDTLFQFLKLDTVLVGSTLRTLASLVCPSRKTTMWENLEIWLFGYQFGTFKDAFRSRLSAFPDVIGFIELLETLLHLNTSVTGKYELPYPQEIGSPRRKPGIYPYLEFLLSDVLYHSCDLYFEEQLALQLPILRIVNNCLAQFDPKLILMSFPACVDLNTVVATRDFTRFVQACPAPQVLSLLFHNKVASCLLDIAGAGIDNINDKKASEKLVKAVSLSLDILQQVLDLEITYFDELSPILRKDTNHIQHCFGLNSFYDILLSNLPVIANIALYIGCKHLPIASKAVKLLREFAKSTQLGGSKAKLLTIFTSVNESLRIKHGLIDQLSSQDFSSDASIGLKLDIFHLINDNLTFGNQEKLTVAHFLLGFNIKNGLSLGSSSKGTFIASSKSLFGTIIFILESSFSSLESYDIQYPQARFASLSLEIILKLCRNSLTSVLIMQHLQKYELVEKLLSIPRLDLRTLWCGTRFDPKVSVPTKFNSGPGIGSFLAMINQRNFISQYLSLELHRTSQTGSISKTGDYINSLINEGSYGKLSGPAKVLLLLDILDFEFEEESSTFEQSQYSFFSKVDLNVDLNSVKFSNTPSTGLFKFEDLDSVLDLQLRQLSAKGLYHTNEEAIASQKAVLDFKNELASTNSLLIQTPIEIISNEDQASLERLTIKSKLTNHLAVLKFKTYQLSALHSWCQLISVIVTDGKLTPFERSEFILEVFETILPRINFEKEILHSEELVSLCVSLYDLYIQAGKEGSTNANIDGFQRLYPLFKTCMQGILSQVSSLTLRSDLYVLVHKYLTWISSNKEVSKEMLHSIKTSSEGLITAITNDAISSKGPTRITALLLLETLYKLSDSIPSNSVLSVLVKNNMLLLLVKSIKRTDESLMHHTTLQSLLYELTAFKATVSLLIRIGETRGGSLALLQSEVFQTIKSCGFLNIDVDLGFYLKFEEYGKVNLNLWDSNGLNVSLLELLTPIFQLISAILLSTSSENTIVIDQVRRLLLFYDKLITGILKKDALMEKKGESTSDVSGLTELVNLFILLSTLTGYTQKE